MTLAVAKDHWNAVVEPPAVGSRERFHQPDPRQFELATRIAGVVLRPLDYIDDEHCRLDRLDAASARAMAQHGAFRGPVNRAVADNIGLSIVTFDDGILSRLRSSSSSRLAILIATAGMDEVGSIAMAFAASALSKRVSRLILKVDRDRARGVLGPEGFQIATQEAPILHPALGDLDRGTMAVDLFGPDLAPEQRQDRLHVLGFHVVGRFLDAAEPVIAKLFSARLPASAQYDERNQGVGAFEDVHCAQAIRFMRRRKPTWSLIIG